MTKGPWHITARAARDYLEIIGAPDTPPEAMRAEQRLLEIARDVVAAGKPGALQDSGALQFRGPRPLRLRLTVMPAEIAGDLPQLVRVRPDHEGRRGPYTQSATERGTGRDPRRKR